MTDTSQALRAAITAALSNPGTGSSDFDLNPEYAPPPGRKLRPAGVLLTVNVAGNEPKVILTKRSSALKHHPGQIAFPGGKQDEGDADVIAAALREAQEEIGLSPKLVSVLGTLSSHETVTGFQVTPVVGMVSEPGEVDEVLQVPLTHVLHPDNFLVQSRRWRGNRRHYFIVPYGPYYIWGATARMLRAFADRMVDHAH